MRCWSSSQKEKKDKKSNKSEENPENRKKVLVDPGRHFPVPYSNRDEPRSSPASCSRGAACTRDVLHYERPYRLRAFTSRLRKVRDSTPVLKFGKEKLADATTRPGGLRKSSACVSFKTRRAHGSATATKRALATLMSGSPRHCLVAGS